MKPILTFCTLTLLLACMPVTLQAQSARSLRINEILVVNQHSLRDSYGHNSPWIEIYNNSPATINIGGCYLSNDPHNPKKYPIPKGDVHTLIGPRQHVLFWADSMPSHGVFHVNFTLLSERENTLYLYDSDGTTLIDKISVPIGQKPDVSYARLVDGKEGWTQTNLATPRTNNKTLEGNEKLQAFKEHDPYGVVITLISMSVVFLALLLLYIVFKYIGKSSVSIAKRRNAREEQNTMLPSQSSKSKTPTDEVYAAIALALYEYTSCAHDQESQVITIKPRLHTSNSPWSAKTQTLRQIPNR